MPRSRWILVVCLIVAGVWSRLVPHPPNFTAIGAASLFAGATMPWRSWSLLVPLAAMVASDAILGFHPLVPVVYLCVALTVVLSWRLRPTSAPWKLAAGGALSSILFFLITNFAVWAEGRIYPMTGEGLLLCYLAGLPFFGNMLAGDVLFSLALVAALRLGERHLPSVRSTVAAAGSDGR